MELHEKLAMLRKNSGYSTRELGEKLGVSQSSVSLWEKGARRPDMGTLVKIANLYGVSTDYLLGSKSDSDKSEIIKLNEQLNAAEREAIILKKEIDDLNRQLEWYQKLLNEDVRYRGNLESYYYTKVDKNLDQELIDKISLRIEGHNLSITKLETEISFRQQELSLLNKLMKSLYSQIHIEQAKDLHTQKSLKKIETKSFNDIRIESENELQIIILKYLGVYDALKDTNLSIDELMTGVKSIIHNNLWKINSHQNKKDDNSYF